MNTVPIGVFSEGTVRPEDVGDAIASLLKPLTLTRRERQLLREWDQAYALDFQPGDDAAECCAELWEILDNYLPPYTHAGSAEGDGACFGVWPLVEAVEEDVRAGEVLKVHDLAEIPRKYNGLVMLVNDHGNVTFGKYRRGRFTTYWEIV